MRCVSSRYVAAVSALTWAKPLCAFIILNGQVPLSVNRIDIQARFAQYYEVVSGTNEIDRSPLQISFQSNAPGPGEMFSLPEWGGGGAFGTSRILVVANHSLNIFDDPVVTLNHELVHVALNRAYPDLEIPRWFHEGVALILSGEISLRHHVILSRALLLGTIPQFPTIDSVNGFNRLKAEICYRFSYEAVRILVQQFGMTSISRILTSALEKNGDWDAALNEHTGMDLAGFHWAVRTEIGRRYGVLAILTENSLVWIAVVFIFLVGIIATAFRNSLRLKQMEQQDNGWQEDTGIQEPDAPPNGTVDDPDRNQPP